MPLNNPNRQKICKLISQFTNLPEHEINDVQILQSYGKINKMKEKRKSKGYIPDNELPHLLYKIWGFLPDDEKIKCFWHLYYEVEKYDLSRFLTFVLPHLVGNPLSFCKCNKNKSIEDIIAIILDTNT